MYQKPLLVVPPGVSYYCSNQNTNPLLTSLEFQFPVTEFGQVEAAISQELGLSIEEVRKLVRYRVRND
jgi:hypothetical protein